LPIADCRLRIVACPLLIADWGFPIADCRLRIVDCGLTIRGRPTADCRVIAGWGWNWAANPQSAAVNPQSTIGSGQSATVNPQSTIGNGQAAIGNPQPAIRNR
jgi:hypothetical protein